MKKILRRTAASALHYSGIIAVMRRCARPVLVIPCYHHVLPAAQRDTMPMPVLAVTPAALADHLAFYTRHYQCLPLAEAMSRLAAGADDDRPMLSVTFDDGYVDNHTHARPVLRDHGVRATFFVISSLVGSDDAPWYDRLAGALTFLRSQPSCDAISAELFGPFHPPDRNGATPTVSAMIEAAKALAPPARAEAVDRITRAAASCGWRESETDRIMDPQQLRDLHADGHEIGAHTRTHPILPQLAPEDCRAELVEARDELEAHVGESVVSLAYPNGDFDDTVVAATADAGYRCAVTTQPGGNRPGCDPLRLHRYFIGEERYQGPSGAFTPQLMAAEFSGLLNGLRRRSRAGSRTP